MNEMIRKKIRVAMAEQGLTQTQLAESVGMKQTHVSRMLLGKPGGGEISKNWDAILKKLSLELVAVEGKSDE